MFYYFTAKTPSALKINGKFCGTLSVEPIKADVNKDDFIEICPLENDVFPINFILSDNFLSHPPKNVVVTDLYGGYLISFDVTVCKAMEVLAQENFSDVIVTVYQENGVNISIETRYDFFLENVKILAKTVAINRHNLNGNDFISVYFEAENLLLVYFLGRKITPVYKNNVTDFLFSNGFTATESFLDIAKHKRIIEWNFDGQNFVKTSVNVVCSDDFILENLPKKILPFAFFEEFFVSGNVDKFLSPDMKENQALLKSYLGDFLGVIVPPKERSQSVVLLYKRSENLFFVKYFETEITDDKISNVKKIN